MGTLRCGALLVTTLLLVLARPADAQVERDGWSVAIGAGTSLGMGGEDRNEATGPGLGLHLRIDRARAGTGFGALVQANWIGGRIANEKRHVLAGVLVLRPWSMPIVLSAGPGIGFITVVDIDGPPPPPGVGDVVVSIGDNMGAALVMGAAVELDVARRLRLEPALDVVAHRASGYTFGTALIGARLRFR
jgi:hypothetical protein